MNSHKIKLPQLNERIWRLKQPEFDIKSDKVDSRFSKILNDILLARGIYDKEMANKFFNVTVDDLLDPFLFIDMEKAVDRISRAKENNEKIIIFGDYDCDGVTATSVLFRFLNSLGLDVGYSMPNRMIDGYGISEVAVKSVIENGCNVAISVDCGITAVDEIQLLADNGIDVILTDHHTPKEEIPDAYAVIVPTVKKCGYPFDKLAGVGVALKFVQALCINMDLKDAYLDYLDLAAIGTVSDMVPLVGENRVIVSLGIERIKQTKWIGLKTLIDSAFGEKPQSITTNSIGFQIAPRINAAGRMGDCQIVMDLLTTDNYDLALELTKQIAKVNILRQQLGESVYIEAEKMAASMSPETKNIIVLYGDKWHIGVLGIVATRITEKFNRPCVIVSFEDGYGKGSARSVEGVDIFKCLSACEKHLIQFGGHKLAAGLTIERTQIEKFDIEINKYAENIVDSTTFVPRLFIDAIIEHDEINVDVANQLALLEPTGADNAKPICLCKNLEVLEARKIGCNDKHLRLILNVNGCPVSAVSFNKGYKHSEIILSKYIDAAVNLEINEWKNKKNIQLKIIDFKISDDTKFEDAYFKSLEEVLWNEDCFNLEMPTISLAPLKMENADTEKACYKALTEYIEAVNGNCTIVINSLSTMRRLFETYKDNPNVVLDLFFNDTYIEYNLNGFSPNSSMRRLMVVVNPTSEIIAKIVGEKVVFGGSWINEQYKSKLTLECVHNSIKYVDFSSGYLNSSKYSLDKDQVRMVYQFIMKKMGKSAISTNIKELAFEFAESYKTDCNIFLMKYSLQIIAEMGFVKIENYDGYSFDLQIIDGEKKTSGDAFSNSETYKWLMKIKNTGVNS